MQTSTQTLVEYVDRLIDQHVTAWADWRNEQFTDANKHLVDEVFLMHHHSLLELKVSLRALDTSTNGDVPF